jgi:hypothetical protein
MAILQSTPVFVALMGDGVSTVFTFVLTDMANLSDEIPISVSILNPPVPITSVTLTPRATVTLTLTSPLGDGAIQTFEFIFGYLSGSPGFPVAVIPSVIVSGTVAVSVSGGTSKVEFRTDDTQLQSTSINASSSGDNIVISGVVGKIIKVFRIFAIASASVQVTLKDGASTALTGPLTLGSFALDFDAEPWFIGTVGNGFILNLGSSAQVSGRVYYTQI